MEIGTFSALAAIVVVVVLFVVLFLQGAYVRHRLEDVERARLGASDPTLLNTSGLSASAVRAYALTLDICKTNELNVGSRLPPLPKEAIPTSAAAVCPASSQAKAHNNKNIKGQWMVLRRTPTALDLQKDVEDGEVRFLIMQASLMRVSSVQLSTLFSDAEVTRFAADYVILVLSEPFALLKATGCLPVSVYLPWGEKAATKFDVTNQGHCGSATTNSAVIIHAWGYGSSPTAFSQNDA